MKFIRNLFTRIRWSLGIKTRIERRLEKYCGPIMAAANEPNEKLAA